MNTYKLIQGDCLQVLPTIDTESINLVVTDPPYNVDLTPQREKHKGTKIIGDNTTNEVFRGLIRKTLQEGWRVLKPDSACFMFGDWKTYPLIYDLLEHPFVFKNCIVWDKLHFGIGYNFRPQYELIFYLTKGEHKINKHDLGNVLRFKKVYEQDHIAEKPERLIKKIILYSSKEDDVVLDPFLGSGTTMESSQHSRRSCIGIEIDSNWCDHVKKRCFGRHFLDREVKYEFSQFNKKGEK